MFNCQSKHCQFFCAPKITSSQTLVTRLKAAPNMAGPISLQFLKVTIIDHIYNIILMVHREIVATFLCITCAILGMNVALTCKRKSVKIIFTFRCVFVCFCFVSFCFAFVLILKMKIAFVGIMTFVVLMDLFLVRYRLLLLVFSLSFFFSS